MEGRGWIEESGGGLRLYVSLSLSLTRRVCPFCHSNSPVTLIVSCSVDMDALAVGSVARRGAWRRAATTEPRRCAVASCGAERAPLRRGDGAARWPMADGDARTVDDAMCLFLESDRARGLCFLWLCGKREVDLIFARLFQPRPPLRSRFFFYLPLQQRAARRVPYPRSSPPSFLSARGADALHPRRGRGSNPLSRAH